MNKGYLSDDELKKLIDSVESEPMLKPPRGFRDDVIEQIRRKRKSRKNMQLFSYSMKVFAATAAALAIVFTVPVGSSPETGVIPERVQEWQESVQQDSENSIFRKTRKSHDERFTYRLNKQMNEYVSILNGKLDQIVRMEVDIDEKEEE